MVNAAIQIRALTPGDLSQVEEIERQSFPNAWPPRELHRFLRCVTVDAMAAQVSGVIAAFAFVERAPGEAHILNFAVHPSHRRAGVGRRLMEAILADARTKGLRKVRLEVRESNVPAQLFYRRLGFRATRILKNHYRDSLEDGYRMECCVLGSPAEPAGAEPAPPR
jgi:ribosomal-protein-alanine N-acetyltransferase